MFYPLFEYTLILYLVVDFINVAISYQKVRWVFIGANKSVVDSSVD